MTTEIVREDRELEERAKLLFEESVSALDAETRSKLTRARYKALEEFETKSPWLWRTPLWRPKWLPAGAIVAGVLAVLVLWPGQPSESPGTQTFDVAELSDLEILLGDEELDMIQELDFYAWLDEQAEIAPVGNPGGGVG